MIESLCCGVPPIVSNCGDVGDVVRDAFNGRIIPDYTDHHAYAAVMIDLLNNPGRIEQLSQNCLTSIEHTDSTQIVQVWNDILTSVRGHASFDGS